MAIPFPEKYLTLLNDNCLIIQKSPQVWKLPRKDTTGRVSIRATNLISTEDKHSDKNITVLIVGETGSGKSTLINGLINFAVGVTWEEDVWFEIIESVKNQADSQTAEVTVYELKQNDFSLTVIDTPGFGDTRGTDGLMTERLLKILGSYGGVGQVHAVGLVLKATENRLSDRMAYVFNSVTSIFGKNLKRNIVALITHSDGRRPTNALQALEAANIQCARNENNDPVYFLFDNCQRDDRKDGTEYLKLAYDTTVENTRLFVEFLQKQESENLTLTRHVLELRKSLETSVQSLRRQVQSLQNMKKNIQQTEEALDKYQHMKEICKNFEEEVIDVYKAREELDMSKWIPFRSEKAINCMRCEVTCWAPGSRWEAMKEGNCTVCPEKCHEKDHEKENWKYVEKFRKVKKTNKDMKERYERNHKKHKAKLEDRENLQKNMSDLEESKKQSLNEIFRIIKELEETALNVDTVSTYVHLDFLIQQMKETGDTQKVQKLETMRDRMDEKNKAGAEYLKTGLMSLDGEEAEVSK